MLLVVNHVSREATVISKNPPITRESPVRRTVRVARPGEENKGKAVTNQKEKVDNQQTLVVAFSVHGCGTEAIRCCMETTVVNKATSNETSEALGHERSIHDLGAGEAGFGNAD